MKKNYQAPKAEKTTFDYEESVVASQSGPCRNVTHYTEWNPVVNCKDVKTYEQVGDTWPVD